MPAFQKKTPDSFSPRLYLGIDPGASGGISLLHPSNLVEPHPMPDTVSDLWELMRELVRGRETRVTALIEKVGGYVKGVESPGSAMFNFGSNYGSLVMALTALKIPFEEITPQRWQKELGIVSRKSDETKKAWKNRLKQHASRLFPRVKLTLRTCDSVLVAECCRRRQS